MATSTGHPRVKGGCEGNTRGRPPDGNPIRTNSQGRTAPVLMEAVRIQPVSADNPHARSDPSKVAAGKPLSPELRITRRPAPGVRRRSPTVTTGCLPATTATRDTDIPKSISAPSVPPADEPTANNATRKDSSMADTTLDAKTLQKAVHDAGLTWTVRAPPVTERHALGRLPADPQRVQQAVAVAHELLQSRLRIGAAGHSPLHLEAAPGARRGPRSGGGTTPAAQGYGLAHTRVIGPVRSGLVRLLRLVLHHRPGVRDGGARARACGLTLSAADQHFCSSHGANCGGWNEADALGQIKLPRRRDRGRVPLHVRVRQPAEGRPE